MKKIISLLLTTVLVFSFLLSASATQVITATSEFDAAKGALIVSGEITNARANFDLTLEMKDSQGKSVYVDNFHVGADCFNEDKTILSYEFAPIKLHPKYASGDYTIYVSAAEIGKASPVTYVFKGADKQFEAISKVKAAIDKSETNLAGAKADLSEVIKTMDADLGIKKEIFTSLGTDGMKVFYDIILSKTYEVPANVDTDANIEKVSEALDLFRKDFLTAIKIADFNDIESDDDASAWLSAYGTDYNVDDKATEVSENLLYPYIADALKEDEKLSERLADEGEITEEADIKSAFYENALLVILESRHYSEARLVFEKFPSIFGIDTIAFSKLDETRQGEVYSEACGNYTSAKEAGEKFNELVDEKLEDSQKDGSEPPKSSGSKGGYSGYTAPSTTNKDEEPTKPTTPPGEKGAFPDVSENMWANEAITSLKEKGIVSGDEKGRFNPDNSITRAEYIKLIVEALDIEKTEKSAGFADVADNVWYKSYIDAAYAAGIVTGNDENCVNPNAYITREDMAVILYRALGKETESELAFADSESVSEYARVGVACLAEMKIINGVGDNMFVPKANATRAQAAQIIYNLLKTK